MKRKKFGLFAVIIAALVATLAVFATACGSKETFSETYTGAVSEKSYASANAAAVAFVESELGGNASDVEFVSYQKEKDLTEAEQNALAIPESAKEGLISVEKGRVNYVEATVSAYSLLAASSSSDLTLWKGVYVLNYGSSFRYYTPALSTGETLTKSYFDSVFNPENYKNVTMTTESVVNAQVTYQGKKTTSKATTTTTYKISETAISIEMTVSISAMGYSTTKKASMYIVEDNGDILCALSENNQWSAVSVYQLQSTLGIEIDSLEDIYRASFGEDIDQSYFVKTSNGFKMEDSKMDEYLATAMGPLDYMFEMLGASGSGYNVKADANYYVRDGKLAKADTAISMNVNISAEGLSILMTVSGSVACNYTNFGSTSVTLPAAARDVLGIY